MSLDTISLAALGSPLGARDLLGLGLHFALLSVLSVGGVIAAAPDMHRYAAVEHRWISSADFTASIALAQAAPGPNVLFVAVLGWVIAGPLGMLATSLGILLPSSAISLLAGRATARRRESRAVRAFSTGLAPVVIGLLFATAWLLAAPYVALPAHRVGAIGLIVASAAVMLGTRWSPMWLIGAGAVVGALGWV